MDLILNNPYRHLGLLVGATAKEQSKQVNRLKMYLDAEQEPDSDYSMPILGNLNRSIESISDATSKINLDIDRINAALFWFYQGNSITDEPALEAIKEGDIEFSFNTWKALTDDKEVTKRNASAYHNLGTLLLSGVQIGHLSSNNSLERGILLKLILLESAHWIELKRIATEQTYKVTKQEVQIQYLQSLVLELKKRDLPEISLIQIINKIDFSAKEKFINSYIEKPINEIQQKINNIAEKRKSDKSNAIKFGESLYYDSINQLNELKSIYGINNIKVNLISDKLADEILQCGIDYYNEKISDSKSKKLIHNVLNLVDLAQTIAVGEIILARLNENRKTINETLLHEIREGIRMFEDILAAYSKMSRDWEAISKGTKIDTSKVNNVLDNFYTTDVFEAIEKCSIESLVERYLTLLEELINKSKDYKWLRKHAKRIVNNLPSNSSLKINIDEKERKELEWKKRQIKEARPILQKQLIIVVTCTLFGLVLGVIINSLKEATNAINYTVSMLLIGFSSGLLYVSIKENNDLKGGWSIYLSFSSMILSGLLLLGLFIYVFWGMDSVLNYLGILAGIVVLGIIGWVQNKVSGK